MSHRGDREIVINQYSSAIQLQRGRRTRLAIVVPALLIALASACRPNSAAVDEGDARRSPPDPEYLDPSDLYRYPAAAPRADSLGVRDLVDRCRGRVVLLYFWSWYNLDCRSELTRLADVQRQMRTSGLSVVAVNIDDPADWRTRSRPMLMSTRGNYPCVIATAPTLESLRTWLDPAWSYQTPACYIFDRAGETTTRTYEQGALAAAVIAARAHLGLSDRAADRPPSGGPAAEGAAASTGPPRLTLRLLNLRTGAIDDTLLPADITSPESVDPLADRIARSVPDHSRRVAVMPFPSIGDNTDAAAAIERFTRGLRVNGLTDLISPTQTADALASAGLDAAAALQNPRAARDALSADYLIVSVP